LIEANQIRVAVIEDSAEFRARLECFLSEVPGVVLKGAAASAQDAIELLDHHETDLLFLDMFLEQGTGIDVLRHLLPQGKPTQVAVITSALSSELEQCCVALGATWFFDKAQVFEAIPDLCAQVRRRGEFREREI
jgi:two-component system response regulator DevR